MENSMQSSASKSKAIPWHLLQKWVYFQAVQAEIVRRHRHRPQPPPLCCQLLPALQSITRWCHWTLSHHPLLLRVESSWRWGWRWTSAGTCCRYRENPWRPSHSREMLSRQQKGIQRTVVVTFRSTAARGLSRGTSISEGLTLRWITAYQRRVQVIDQLESQPLLMIWF